ELERVVADEAEERARRGISDRHAQHEPPAARHDPRQLVERRVEVAQMLEHAHADERAELAVAERQLEQRSIPELDLDPQRARHGLDTGASAVDVDSDEPARPTGELRQEDPRPVADVEHRLEWS